MYSWGLNVSGQLGHGDLSSTPVLIPVCSILIVLLQVYSWGLNVSGQLGHGDLSSAPVLIPVCSILIVL